MILAPRGGVSRRIGEWGLVLLLGLATAPAWSQTVDFIRGDVNQDGEVSFGDLIPLIHNTALPESGYPPPSCLDSADINDDGQVDIADAFSMIVFLFDPATTVGLPLPYPDEGTDPTPDLLPICGISTPPDPDGSEIPHIYFSLGQAGGQGLAAFPGQTGVCLPVYLDTVFPIEGYTISVQYDPAQVASSSFDFAGSIAVELSADVRISEIPSEFPGFRYSYVVMELVPPFTATEIPAGFEIPLGNIVIDLNPDVAPGDTVTIAFQETPPSGDESPVRTEVVQQGGDAVEPVLHDLDLPIVVPSGLFVRGDASVDGTVNLVDAVAVIGHLFGPEFLVLDCPDAADADDDGTIGLTDVFRILSYLFSDGPTPAAPFPHPGLDPSPDPVDICSTP